MKQNINVQCGEKSHIWQEYLERLKNTGYFKSKCIDLMLIYAAKHNIMNISHHNNAKQPKHYKLTQDEVKEILKRFPKKEKTSSDWFSLSFEKKEEEIWHGATAVILNTDDGYMCIFEYYKTNPQDGWEKKITHKTFRYTSDSLNDLLDILESLLFDYVDYFNE